MITDWDDAYANGKHVADSDMLIERWAEEAAAFRAEMDAAGRFEADIAYGGSPREMLDLFIPEMPPSGLMVFVHGGYWMKLAKDSFSHMARGAVKRGWAAAIPSYDLAPNVAISSITRQIGQAIDMAATRVDGPIHIAGHSAGGHLVSRMACVDSPLDQSVRNRLKRVVSISGLHDLRPLLKTAMNDVLRLDTEEAFRESAALNEPFDRPQIVCWVGSGERPEFIRQNDLLVNVWTGLGADIRAYHDTGRHHFDVIDGLADPDSALSQTAAGVSSIQPVATNSVHFDLTRHPTPTAPLPRSPAAPRLRPIR